MKRILFVLLLALVCLSFGALTFAPAAALPAATPTPTAAATESPVESGPAVLWSFDGGPNAFSYPNSLALDQDNHLYILDSGHDRVQKFDRDGNFLLMWGKYGHGEGEFNFNRESDWLGGITVDPQGNVYVADTSNQRVQKFDGEGNFLMMWGSKGTDDGQFLSPLDVAIDAQGNSYVVDDRRDDVQKFDAEGHFLLKFAGHGRGDGKLFNTGGITVDRDGSIYVADFENHRVEKFDSEGRFLLKWGSLGPGDDQFDTPCDVALDAQGNVYVTNFAEVSNQVRVQEFTSSGEFLARWGSRGSAPGEFQRPCGIVVDGAGDVFVADYSGNTVQKFRLTADQ